MIKRPVPSRRASFTALLRPLRVTSDPHGKPGTSSATLTVAMKPQSSSQALYSMNIQGFLQVSAQILIHSPAHAHSALQDRRPYPSDAGLAYSTSWPPYDSSPMLASGSDSINLTLPGASSSFQFYPPAFETSSFQLPDTTYPTPPPTGAVSFEPHFGQHEFFSQPPPNDAPNPFILDAPKPIVASSSGRNSSLAIRSRTASQPHLRTQLSMPSPFPAYRSIQSFPVNLPYNRHSSSSSPTDEVPPIRRHATDRVSKSTPNLSEVIVPTEEESTAFISKLYQ
jgi:hypothetical protein